MRTAPLPRTVTRTAAASAPATATRTTRSRSDAPSAPVRKCTECGGGARGCFVLGCGGCGATTYSSVTGTAPFCRR